MSRHSTVRKGTGCIGGEKDLSRTGTLSRGDASVESPFVPQHVPFTSSTVKVLVVRPRGTFCFVSWNLMRSLKRNPFHTKCLPVRSCGVNMYLFHDALLRYSSRIQKVLVLLVSGNLMR